MVPRTALEHRRLHPVSPYNVAVWEDKLCTYDLLLAYPNLLRGLQSGFNINLPVITHTQSPPNSPSLITFRDAFQQILARELTTGRYIGPFSHVELLSLLGPYQSSPISIIPKPGKAGKFRVIQNFSFPLLPSPAYPNASINSSIDSNDFPCTWGTFDTICTIIRSLPPGSQAATRDVAEAYRTIPLHSSQWPAAVVRLPDGDLCIDTCISFGMGPSAGTYGHVADAGVDLLRAEGLGPLAKWVDDHLFFRILREFMEEYNRLRKEVHVALATGGSRQSEDCRFQLRDLSQSSPRAIIDEKFTFAFADIDRVSQPLGIPWEPSKDTAFAYEALFLGLLWGLPKLSVELSPAKKGKYLAAIEEWRSQKTHVLLDVQKLYGKLLHASLVVRMGRAYLTSLETMLGICHSCPFVPHHSVRHLNDDLNWWSLKLTESFVGKTISQPRTLVDIRAFSDASSTVGIAIVINGYWRAWTLRPGWQTLNGQRDIGWAEGVGFDLLTLAILDARREQPFNHFRVFCDNQGIVNGWRNGRSRNWATNLVFRRIYDRLECISPNVSFHLCYVPSADNPADGPSRGVFPPRHLLLPPLVLPGDLSTFLIDADLSPRRPNTTVNRVSLNREAGVDELVDEADDGEWGNQLLELHDTWRD